MSSPGAIVPDTLVKTTDKMQLLFANAVGRQCGKMAAPMPFLNMKMHY
jgi:hypothetical protein